ncbi:MAG: hypothetical protein QG665_460 [Patescibacteria group bacterium]|nr:hypothetical protein [Patescibacteria group bacterium]
MHFPLEVDGHGDPTFKEALFQEFKGEPVRASVVWLKRVAILSALCQHVYFFRLESLGQVPDFFDIGVLKTHYESALGRYMTHEIKPDYLLMDIKWPIDEDGNILWPKWIPTPCSEEKRETIMVARRFLAQEMKNRLELDHVYSFGHFAAQVEALLDMVKVEQRMP